MALIYTKTLATDKWLFSENNNIIEFTDDVSSRNILYVEFTTTQGLNSRIYADSKGVVWYNVKEYVSAVLSDYTDDINLSEVDVTNIETFLKNWDKMFFNYDLNVLVVFEDGQVENTTIDVNFILGVEQTTDYFKEMTVSEQDMFILSPLKENTNNTHYLNYWEGYPFDIGFTCLQGTDGDNIDTITNISTTQILNIAGSGNFVNRLVVSNGTTDVTIEDYLPLPFGFNKLMFGNNTFVELNKISTKCGTYVKWLNQYGGYNYWLFNNSQDKSKSKSKGVIDNDFNNLYDSVSETKSLGRISSDQIECYYENLNKHEIRLLSGLLESPKIYLYLGKRYAKRPVNSWIEINIPSSNIVTRTFKNKVPSGTITLSLPPTKSISL